MKVSHVVPSIAELSSGPSHSVPALCDALASFQVEVTLHVLEPVPAHVGGRFAVRGYPFWRLLERLGISPAMKQGLREAAGTADILHNHSLWMMPNIYPTTAIRRSRCRLVTSPRGTLSTWALARSRWRKRLLWYLCQGRVLRNSACLHATSELEFQDIRRAGLHAPVAIIPNGVELPTLSEDQPIRSGPRHLLFLGRIHPKKGVDVLLKAWRRVQDFADDWELHIVGPDNEGYRPQMQQLSRSLGNQRVFFRDAVHGEQRREVFERAGVFVLPTHSENFGMTVAESLAHGVPAIVSRGAPWPELEKRQCGWWIDLGENALIDCLRAVLALSPEELRRRGTQGRKWMEHEFSWLRVGQMMHETYQWLLGSGVPPSWVRRDV